MRRVREVLVTVGWAITIASIALQALYQGFELLPPLSLALLFIVSVLAGVVLVEPGIIVFGFFGALAISMLVMFVCWVSPAVLGTLPYAILGGFLYEAAFATVFRSLVPAPVILCLMGALFGGVIGERIMIR